MFPKNYRTVLPIAVVMMLDMLKTYKNNNKIKYSFFRVLFYIFFLSHILTKLLTVSYNYFKLHTNFTNHIYICVVLRILSTKLGLHYARSSAVRKETQ